MKKSLLLMFAMGLLLFSGSVAFALPNPSATYCEDMGYDYEVIDQSSFCVFPDGEKCDAWEFMDETCGAEYQKEIACKEAGDVVGLGSCCEGLGLIENDEPGDIDGCAGNIGGYSICSECGNDVCEEWENTCNCPVDCVDNFPDVTSDNRYAKSIEYLHSKNLLKGDSDTGMYRPFDNINRAEFATILSRLLGQYEQTLEENLNCFPDVTNQWFAGAVCQVKEFGLMKGYDAGEMAGMFGPSEPLLNAEIIMVLARFANWDLEEPGIAAEWYEPAWNYAITHNIIERQSVGAHTIRGLMADLIFRAAVVKRYALDSYSETVGQTFIDNEESIDLYYQ